MHCGLGRTSVHLLPWDSLFRGHAQGDGFTECKSLLDRHAVLGLSGDKGLSGGGS